jgi:hypothetical protein
MPLFIEDITNTLMLWLWLILIGMMNAYSKKLGLDTLFLEIEIKN